MSHHMKANDVCLGDYVVTHLGQRGRVSDMHWSCPEDADWLADQGHLSAKQKQEWGWASVLVADGGAVVMPTSAMKVIDAFDMRDQRDYYFYFRD